MGPNGVNVPSQVTALLGKIKVGDLIGTDVRLEYEGTTVRAIGTVKNIEDPWTDFSAVDNTGHFFPIELPARCVGKDITAKGRSAEKGDRTVRITEDRLLVIRLENLEGNTMEIDMDSKELMVLDFSGVSKQ